MHTQFKVSSQLALAAFLATSCLVAHEAAAKGPHIGDAIYQFELEANPMRPAEMLRVTAFLDREAVCERADFIDVDTCRQMLEDGPDFTLEMSIFDSALPWNERSIYLPMQPCGESILCGELSTEGLAEGRYQLHQFNTVEIDERVVSDPLYSFGLLIDAQATSLPGQEDDGRPETPLPDPDDKEVIGSEDDEVSAGCSSSSRSADWLMSFLVLGLVYARRRRA